MRTTFFEMQFLDDTPFMNNASYIRNGKEWGKSKTEREGKHIKSKRQVVAEKGLEAWVNGQLFMRAEKRDNPRVYQDGNKTYCKNFWWSIFSLSATIFFIHKTN
jgi:hypothetical protein